MPRHRYASAEDLAEDLQRHLAGQAIRARPPSMARRLARFARRRPATSTLLAAVFVLASGLLGVRRLQVDREQRHAREVAAIDRRHTEALVAEADRARRLLYDVEVNRAFEALGRDRIELARQILRDQRPQPGQPDLRGFEWHYLWRRCHRDLVLRGHEGSVRALAFAPDGRTLASAGSDRVVRLWDASDWTPRTTLRGHDRLVSCLLYAADGSLYSGGFDGRLLRWDAEGRSTTIQGPGAGAVLDLALPRGGDTVALSSGGDVEEIVLLNRMTGDRRRGFRGHHRVAWSLAFSPDGATLAGGSADGRSYLWNLRSGPTPVRFLGDPVVTENIVLAWAGRSVLTCGADRRLRLWDVETGEARWESVAVCESPVTALALGDDDRTLAVGHWDGVALWDLAGRRPLGELGGQTGAVHALAFAPGAATLASAGDDGVIHLWDAATARPLRTEGSAVTAWAGQADLAARPQCLAFSPDGRRIAVGYDGGAIEVRERSTGAVLRDLALGNAPYMVRALGFADNGRTLAASGDNVPVRLWDVETGQELAGPPPGVPEGPVTWWALAVGPGDRGLIFANGHQGQPGRIAVHPTRTAGPTATLLGHDDYIRAVALAPDGQTLASGSGDETVRLWDVVTGRSLATLRGHLGQVFAVAIDRQGTLVASGAEDQTVRLWDIANRCEVAALQGHTSPVHSVAFHPDGRRLASAARDGLILVWDVATRRPVARLEGHTQRVNQVAFSPDGEALISVGFDQSIRVWDARSVEEAPHRSEDKWRVGDDSTSGPGLARSPASLEPGPRFAQNRRRSGPVAPQAAQVGR